MIAPLIPPPGRMCRPRQLDMREVFNAVQLILRTGCQYRAIPKCFPPSTSVQNHFYAWRDYGRMLDALRTLARELEGRSAEPMAAAVDSQSVTKARSVTGRPRASMFGPPGSIIS
ncbi:MAG: transposase [Paracoccaceae bacterium]|nr:transposase [Paracoccaceae bacterium]MDE2912435.1 transposase [Paracoccaceae bacterium]